jgi:glucose-1-phosphate thymidylyltransferase
VHAGDTHILSDPPRFLNNVTEEHFRRDADATLVLHEVEDVSQYGVAEVSVTTGGIAVTRVVEKPKEPQSNLAIMPIYVFSPRIFKALDRTMPDARGEIQLTDAIQMLIAEGSRVYAVKLEESEVHFDIGTPQTYWTALDLSHRYSMNGN